MSGGGSGHEPAHIGYVGEGMLTAAIYGQLFTPPTRAEILESIRFLNNGHGVFIIVKNFEADIKEFSSPLTLLDKKELKSAIVYHTMIFQSNPTINFKLEGEGLQGQSYFIKF